MNVGVLIGLIISIFIGVILLPELMSSVEEAQKAIETPTPTTTSILPNILQQPTSVYSDLGIPKEFGGPTWTLVILAILVVLLIVAWIIGKKKKFKILEGD